MRNSEMIKGMIDYYVKITDIFFIVNFKNVNRANFKRNVLFI